MLCRMVPVSPAGTRGRRPSRLDTGTIQTLEQSSGRYSIFQSSSSCFGCHQHRLQGGSWPTTARCFSVSTSRRCLSQSSHTQPTVERPVVLHAEQRTPKPIHTDTYPVLANTCQYMPFGPHKIHADTYQYIHSTYQYLPIHTIFVLTAACPPPPHPWSAKEYCIRPIISCNFEPIFCVQDCRPLIAQIAYQSQIQNTRILVSKPFIDRCYCSGHRLQLKYFLVTQILLNPYLAAHQLQKSGD